MKKIALYALVALLSISAYAKDSYVPVKDVSDLDAIKEKYIPKADENIVYKKFPKEEKTKGNFEPKLQIYYPNNKKPETPLPCAIFFAGGGWKNAHPTQFSLTSRILADLGIVGIFAEYRTKKTMGVEDPTKCVEDAKSAVRYVREHAEELGINPNMIAVGGASAGGHIATATSCLDNFDSPRDNLEVSCVPNLLLLFNPVIDNSEGNNSYDRVKHIFPAISPMQNLKEKMPPSIIFVGSDDIYCRPVVCENYKAYLESKSIDCELYIYDGQVHSFFNYYKSREMYLDTLKKMIAFLKKHKYIQ